MKKITAITGSLSYLIDELADIYNKDGDMPVAICGKNIVHVYYDEANNHLVLDCEDGLEDTVEYDILNKLNREWGIIKMSYGYMTSDTGEIVATNEKEMAEYYIDVFNYKMDLLSTGEDKVRQYYRDIIKELGESIKEMEKNENGGKEE